MDPFTEAIDNHEENINPEQDFSIFFKTEIGKVRVGSGKYSLMEAGFLTIASHGEEGVYELPFTPHDFGTTEVTVKFRD